MSVNMQYDFEAEFDDDSRRILETSGELSGIVLELQALIAKIHEEQGEFAPRSAFARPTEEVRAPQPYLQVLSTIDVNDIVEEACRELSTDEASRVFADLFPYSLPIMVDAPLMVLAISGIIRHFLDADPDAEVDLEVSTCATRGGAEGEMDGCIQMVSSPLRSGAAQLEEFATALVDALGAHEEVSHSEGASSISAWSHSVLVQTTAEFTRVVIRRPLSSE